MTEVPDPVPAPDEVVVEVDACGLCGSDVHASQNGRARSGRAVLYQANDLGLAILDPPRRD